MTALHPVAVFSPQNAFPESELVVAKMAGFCNAVVSAWTALWSVVWLENPVPVPLLVSAIAGAEEFTAPE
jgi:hypothetical protein